MNGMSVFTVNFECGCVVSQKAMVETKTNDICLGCGGPLKQEKLVQLYPDAELLERYEAELTAEQAARKAKKAEKKADDAKFAKPALPGTSEITSSAIVASENSKVITKVKAAAGQKRKAESTSIQQDPTISKAVKSLFTSCDAAQKQPKQHWVTHNPLYF